MRKFSVALLMLVLSIGWNNVSAQNEIIINEVMEYMSKGEKTGYEVAILDAEPKNVEATWMKIMKKYKAKVTNSKKSVEIFADNAVIPNISANSVDIYAIASKASYGTRLTVFVDLGGSFISSQDHEVAFGAFENFLRDVAHQEAVRVVDGELKLQSSVMKDLQKELESLLKSKDNYLKDIEKAKTLIAQREANVVDNEAAQETKRQQIEIQKEIIETIQQKRTELEY